MIRAVLLGAAVGLGFGVCAFGIAWAVHRLVWGTRA